MKILIVDDRVYTKCAGIMEECKERNIEVEVVTSINQALKTIIVDAKDTIDGIILDMGLPIYQDGSEMNTHGGERILRELERKEIRIPILVFSETEMRSNYVQVFGKMRDWNIAEEQYRFFEFLKKLEKKY